MKFAYVHQGYTGEPTAEAAAVRRIDLCTVKLAETKGGFVLLTSHWVEERIFAWASQFRS